MKTLARLVLIIGAPALFAGCGGSQLPIGAPGAMAQNHTIVSKSTIARDIEAAASSYHVLYSFGSGSDGKNPNASLIDVKGTLYGATLGGGAYSGGTAYSITSGGKEKVLHSFGNGADGYYPNAALIDVGGTLYGTTEYGGSGSCSASYKGCGTVFSITTGGTENVLHRFGGAKADGSNPLAGLIYAGGMLYGATKNGGLQNSGAIFSITTAGTEKLLHSFGQGTDGRYPDGTLVDVKGTLYGTTFNGGAHGGEGTVFSITTSGAEKVLHSFGKGTDGSEARAGLIDVGGTLYGTTFQGGSGGGGTVFRIATDGKEKVLHNFGEGTDGYYPLAGLIDAGGTLFGTTYGGGAYGVGTAFSITTSGAEKVLHSFGNGSDGVYPVAGLIEVNKTLYSTTYNGGSQNAGTVFAITP